MVKVKEDFTGRKFGRLFVIERAEDKIRKSGEHISAWQCQCDCGNSIIAEGASLKSGRTQSCGCLRIERAKEKVFIDITGKRYGYLTVIKQVDDVINQNGRHRKMWLCKCDCGNETIVEGRSLKGGNTQSCGCLQKTIASQLGKESLVDLTGMTFGRLSVIGRAESVKKRTMWNCRCLCGREVCVSGGHLKNGHTQSCGCYIRELTSELYLNNLVGQKFGELTVIERAPNRRIDETYWKCLCSCGSVTEVRASDLTGNRVMSCGCQKISCGETLVANYLERNKIKFEREYRFSDCIDKRELPFDFYVPKYNSLIEVQGKQHYEPVDFAGRGIKWAQNQFTIVQRHDKIKRDYCQEHNIKLICIPYTEFDNIEMILVENLS